MESICKKGQREFTYDSLLEQKSCFSVCFANLSFDRVKRTESNAVTSGAKPFDYSKHFWREKLKCNFTPASALVHGCFISGGRQIQRHRCSLFTHHVVRTKKEALKRLSTASSGRRAAGGLASWGNTNLLIAYNHSMQVSISTIITMGHVTNALCAGWYWMTRSRRNHLGVHHRRQLWIKALLAQINHDLWCSV